MDVLAEPVLVLNAGYVPIAVRPVRDALVLLILEKADVVRYEKSLIIRSERQKFYAPRIILLTNYFKVPQRKWKLSRSNIFKRDNFRCVYCQKPFSSSKLTLDHVIPRSRWNEISSVNKPFDFHSWENLVSACKPCNTKKGNKLLSELHWKVPEVQQGKMKRIAHFSVSEKLAEQLGWRDFVKF